jgi:hypothetical protein
MDHRGMRRFDRAVEVMARRTPSTRSITNSVYSPSPAGAALAFFRAV